jgi:hypothetical protein
MRPWYLLFCFSLLLSAAVINLACGNSSPKMTAVCGGAASSSSNSTGVLQSITVCPATADAQNYSGDQVPFTAFGTYSTPPSPISPITASWGACYQNAPTTAVSVTSQGLAECAGGAHGTYTVYASQMTACNAITACGGGCQVTGIAQLTCP